MFAIAAAVEFSPLFKRMVIFFVVMVVVAAAAILGFAWKPTIAPIALQPAAGFAPALVEQGRVLAGAGNCAACHTPKSGAALAGGLGFKTDFGTIYSSNITPDAETGIGGWSLPAFARAMHSGVARDGSQLLPVFPYDHFTKVSDADIAAIYAWLMTRPAIRKPATANTVPFPLNIRPLQAVWKRLFFTEGRFQPEATRSAEWNRGAYLAEGLSHCGGCHTPRNLLGAERAGEANAGAVIEGWIAPSLTATNPAPVAWDADELFFYLRTGMTALHGSAAGPMSPVVHDGLAALPDADVRAIAVYFASSNGSAARPVDAAAAWKKALATPVGLDPDARLYAAACGSCHYNAGATPSLTRPELALNSALFLSEPTNLIQVVLHGIGVREGASQLIMPAYDRALGDADIARLAAYLRRTRTTLPPWPDLEAKVAAVRKEATAG
jgi:mono/diheme cytochrome c family protein